MWLEATLAGLGALPHPPRCLVLDAARETLPASIRDATHVHPVPLVRKTESKIGSLAQRILRRTMGRPWEDAALTRVGHEHGVDLWVGFSGMEGLGAHRPLLVWYPDFQCRHFPEFFPAQEIQERERQWDYLARRADGILVISQSVADDALGSHPQVAEKLHVCGFPPVFTLLQLGLDPDEVRRKYDLPERFFLVSNQFWQHKNHALVLRSLSHLRQCGNVPPVVAFTGRPHDYRRPDAFSEILQFAEQQGLHQYCRFLGVVPRAEQLALIRAAEAVIQPSLFEGRGAIGEEATVLGTQLLCSDIPVHHELNVPGALFFPTDGVAELAELMSHDYPRALKDTRSIAAESQLLTLDYGERFIAVIRKVLGG